MKLYLIRHADALPLDETITEDRDRPLSPEGVAQARVIAEGLQRQGVELQVLFTSPLLRARQTAEHILEHWSSTKPELQTCKQLSPGAKRRSLSRLLLPLAAEHVGLIGHQPHLGDFASWVIGSKKAQIELAKAGVACIECNGVPTKGTGSLVWLVTPEWLEK